MKINVTTKNTVYGWQAGDKFCLSRSPATVKDRPFNTYDTRQEAEDEARSRRCAIVWEQDNG